MKKIISVLIVSTLAVLGVPSSNGATFTVVSLANNDFTCSANATNTAVCAALGVTATTGSLAWCITMANSTPGADIIDFNLPSGSIIAVANPDWLLITEAVTIDATLNNMAAAWATAGSCNPVLRINYGFSSGFNFTVAACSIRGLALNTDGNAISFDGAAVTSGFVRGCWIGLDLTGNAIGTAPQQGVRIINAASGIIVGGNTCAFRNVILAGNNGGVYFDNGDNSTVIGNYFNTTFNGSAIIIAGGQACIRMVAGSSGNIIGTNNANEGNVFVKSGGQAGVFIEGATSINNTIRNNIIGFAANGVLGQPAAFADYPDHGIRVVDAVGGTIDNNTIGGFNRFGINFENATNNWTINNNRIGTDITGNVARRNEEGGIFINNAVSGIVVTNNLVSGNGTPTVVGPGFHIRASCTSCNIQNNTVGVAANNSCLSNSGSGIFMETTTSALTFIQNNTLGCNGYANLGGQLHGIHLLNCSNVNVLNNFTGTNSANTQLGNHQDGISMNACSNILVSGNTSRNNNWGIFMQANGGANIVIGNTITGNGFNNTPLPKPIVNEGGGICVQTGNNGNFLGRALAGEGNIISGNKVGIHLRGDPGGATGTTVYNNTISGSLAGNYSKYATDYSGAGVVVSGGSGSTRIGGTAALQRNVINVNQSWGILVDNSDQVEIRRNIDHCNGGTAANQRNPIYAIRLINGANSNLTEPGPLTSPPIMTAATGIAIANVPNADVNASDIVEVYYDNSCGCQLLDYRGDAVNGGTGQWSFAGASLPAAAYCTPGAALPGGQTCPPSGLNSVTATRTVTSVTPGRTSEPMSCTPTILPVDLIRYDVKRYSSTSSIITWVTAEEKNNAYFQLLRSSDGQRFIPIANIAGTGDATAAKNYEYIDENLDAGTYYYMLVQVDFDGTEHMKGIRQVSFTGEIEIEVLPNSVIAGTPVTLINLSKVVLRSVTMVELNGRQVFEQRSNFEDSISIQTTGLAPALYIIRIQTDSDVITKKVIVH